MNNKGNNYKGAAEKAKNSYVANSNGVNANGVNTNGSPRVPYTTNTTNVVETKPKAKKSFVLPVAVGMLIVGVVLGALLIFKLTPVNPLGQYIITRTCEFISMGNFRTAVCVDGTSWTVSPFQD
jgi:hypothetical protein